MPIELRDAPNIPLPDVDHVGLGLLDVVSGSPFDDAVPVVGDEEEDAGQEHERAVEEDLQEERHACWAHAM